MIPDGFREGRGANDLLVETDQTVVEMADAALTVEQDLTVRTGPAVEAGIGMETAPTVETDRAIDRTVRMDVTERTIGAVLTASTAGLMLEIEIGLTVEAGLIAGLDLAVKKSHTQPPTAAR